MAGAEVAIDKTRTVAQKNDWKDIMGDIYLDLLDGADRYEGGQAIDKWSEANARQAGSHTHHVLLSDAGVDILIRATFAEFIKK
jgi:hypothetical protein